MSFKKLKNGKTINYVISALLLIGAVAFLYYSFKPQYDIIDHEGYKGGAVVLSGYIAFVLLANLVKKKLIECGKSNYIYILSICNVIASFICVKALIMYRSRVYVLSLVMFWIIPFMYSVARIFFKRRDKKLSMGFLAIMGCASIMVMLSTVIRGLYIILPSVVATLSGTIFLLALSIRDDFFPYDYFSWLLEVKDSFFDKFKISFVVIISYVTLYFLLSPLELYVTNRLTFSFGYKTFLPILLILGVLASTIGAAILSLFTGNTNKLINCSLAIISILSYVQYMFMNTKLMEEDGSRLNLNTMGKYPVINLIVWVCAFIVLGVVLLIIKDKWKTCICAVCGFIAIIQFIAVISLVIACINSPASRYYQMSGDVQFSVAKDKNIIVLVPDTFSRGRFEELLEYDPEGNYMDIFKDFTYYDEMYSECFPTLPAINHLLTDSEIIEGQEGMDTGVSDERVQWQKETWGSDKCKAFFDEIHNNGYSFYMNITTPCELVAAYDDVVGKIDNIEYAESNVDKSMLTKMLVSMSCYSCFPYVMKPQFEYFSWDFAELEQYEGVKSFYKNEDFYAEVCRGITIDEHTDNKVHFINWHGFHNEWTNDEFCNPAPQGTVSRPKNSKGVMLCIKTYLDELRKIGRYDDCTIIIMGDHGDRYVNDGCVFVKMPGEEHEEVVLNHGDYTYSGFRATILEMMGDEKAPEFGRSWIDNK